MVVVSAGVTICGRKTGADGQLAARAGDVRVVAREVRAGPGWLPTLRAGDADRRVAAAVERLRSTLVGAVDLELDAPGRRFARAPDMGRERHRLPVHRRVGRAVDCLSPTRPARRPARADRAGWEGRRRGRTRRSSRACLRRSCESSRAELWFVGTTQTEPERRADAVDVGHEFEGGDRVGVVEEQDGAERRQDCLGDGDRDGDVLPAQRRDSAKR